MVPKKLGKKLPLNPKSTRKISDASKSTAKEPPISRKKHVFGTSRNTNTDKPLRKPFTAVPQKQPKASTNASKKSICFQKQEPRLPEEGEISASTPPLQIKSDSKNVTSTPYYTPENYRFHNRLETASYWLCQIKLAESVGNHFVSAAFFGLAFESKAEPVTKLRSELKHYLARHEGLLLSSHTEWRNVSLIYKLLKEEDHCASTSTSNNIASENKLM